MNVSMVVFNHHLSIDTLSEEPLNDLSDSCLCEHCLSEIYRRKLKYIKTHGHIFNMIKRSHFFFFFFFNFNKKASSLVHISEGFRKV